MQQELIPASSNVFVLLADLGSSKLILQQRQREPRSFLKKITDAVASYHHFTATAIRYFGVSSGQRQKFARALLSAHVDSNCSSHCFALILDELFAIS